MLLLPQNAELLLSGQNIYQRFNKSFETLSELMLYSTDL